MKSDLKKSEFLKSFYNLFVFGCLFTVIKMIFYGEENIEIRLLNLVTYVFKGHVKIIKIYMMEFNVSTLNRLKIMGFCKYKVYKVNT